MSMADTPAPFQPGPTRSLARVAGAQQLPQGGLTPVAPPPALGGPAQMGGQFGAGAPAMAPMAAPAPQVAWGGAQGGAAATPTGGQLTPAGGQGAPQQGAPQGGPPATQGAQGGQGAAQPDLLDQFVDWQTQRVMAGAAHPDDLAQATSMKEAKDRDPQLFWMMLNVTTSGDPDRMMQFAMEMRKQREQQRQWQQKVQVEREGQVMQLAGQRMGRNERSADREDYAQQQRVRDQVARWANDGSLGRIEERLGRPVTTYADLQEAQRTKSMLADDDKFTKEKSAYLKGLAKGPVAAGGRIKDALTNDASFKGMADWVTTQRDEDAKADREYAKAKLLHMRQLNAVLADKKIDPGVKRLISDTHTELMAAHREVKSAKDHVISSTSDAKLDELTGGRLGGADTRDQWVAAQEEAEQREADVQDRYDNLIASIGAPAAPRRTTSTVTPPPTAADDGPPDELLDDEGNVIGYQEPPPPAATPKGTPTPRKSGKSALQEAKDFWGVK